jgi:hypothetical protein
MALPAQSGARLTPANSCVAHVRPALRHRPIAISTAGGRTSLAPAVSPGIRRPVTVRRALPPARTVMPATNRGRGCIAKTGCRADVGEARMRCQRQLCTAALILHCTPGSVCSGDRPAPVRDEQQEPRPRAVRRLSPSITRCRSCWLTRRPADHRRRDPEDLWIRSTDLLYRHSGP